MFQVAVVEDESVYARTMEDYLDRYGREKELSLDVTMYHDAVDLLTRYQPKFDLIFMDIQMPHINGFEAAQHLRELDPKVPLVFVTSHIQYAPKGYDVAAAGFLIKPVSYYSFYTLMDKIVRTTARDKDSELLVHTREGIRVLSYSEILYVEISNHSLKYVTERGELEATGSISALEEQLPGDQFVRCSNSFLVHLKFVRGITGNAVQVGNKELPISRSRKKEFTLRLLSYFGDRA